RPFESDGEDALRLIEMFGPGRAEVIEEAMNGAESDVARAGAVAVVAFKVIEERKDGWRRQLCEGDPGDGAFAGGEAEQALEAVAIGQDGVWAEGLLPRQVFSQKAPQGDAQTIVVVAVVHRPPPCRRRTIQPL